MDRSIKARRIKFHKIDAVRRQIESAIWLWFVDGDMVSVHTLTAGAHRLLLELATLWGVSAPPFTGAHFAHPKAGRSITASTDPVVFFRSAKQDESFSLCQRWTERYLFDAVMAYQHLTRNHPPSVLMALFIVRFGVEQEELFADGAFAYLEEKISSYFNRERLVKLSKLDFLQEFFGGSKPKI